MGYDVTTMWGWGAWMMLVMSLAWITIVVAIVWLAVRLFRPDGTGDAKPNSRPALRILEERLARGEIDVEEFRTRSAALAEGR